MDFPACFGGRPRRFGVGVGVGVGAGAGLFGGRPRRVGVVANSASTPNAALLIAAGLRPRFFGGTFDDEGGRPRLFLCDAGAGAGAGVILTSFTASFFGGRPRRFVGVVFETARAFAFEVSFAVRFALTRGAAGSAFDFEPARTDGDTFTRCRRLKEINKRVDRFKGISRREEKSTSRAKRARTEGSSSFAFSRRRDGGGGGIRRVLG